MVVQAGESDGESGISARDGDMAGGELDLLGGVSGGKSVRSR